MSGFSAEWLDLRAGADDRARAPDLIAALRRWAGDRPVLIADLGGGSGATRRALRPQLPAARWRVIDHDPALLSAVTPGADLETALADLAADPGAAFAGSPDLVAASAFFDLVSAGWIDDFADRLAARRMPLYAALTYDGREEWRPTPPHEARALAAFHQDKGRDKGFGPALGPAAAARLAAGLRARGFSVTEAASDWRLTPPRDAALIAALAAGGAEATEVRDALSPDQRVA
ncbi:MAG: class I SAM-dependent methyltransferase, partial [Paracoccaceae bacterium]